MTPLILSQSDSTGGAARAAFRLHKALHAEGTFSRMLVRDRQTDFPGVYSPGSIFHPKTIGAVRSQIGNALFKSGRASVAGARSANWIPSAMSSSIEKYLPDVVNLHWVGGETISIAEIGHIPRPLVWTIHDMWLFCGSEHYAEDAENSRWRRAYTYDWSLSSKWGWDLDRWVWHRKQKQWRRPMQIIAPSRWLADCAASSVLLHGKNVACIPNPLDTEIFAPRERDFCRSVLGLPSNAFLVAFGAINGEDDPRKGFDLLRSALERAHILHPEMQIHAVVFGQSAPRGGDLSVPVKWMGHLYDDVTLSLLYSAVDVVIVPSRQENLPQTATEAQACGCPVLAFDCTGLPDAVVHKETGYLARPFDAADLANGLNWLYQDSVRLRIMKEKARSRAQHLWSPQVVIPQYLDVYKQAIDEYGAKC